MKIKEEGMDRKEGITIEERKDARKEEGRIQGANERKKEWRKER